MNVPLDSDIYERLDRIDRRIRVIGRIVIMFEMFGGGCLAYFAGASLGASPPYAFLVGVAAGLGLAAFSRREFDR